MIFREAGDANLRDDPTSQDAILLNLQCACKSSIDLAMRVVRKRRRGVPQESREVFEIFERANVLPADLARSMRTMVCFRDVVVHNDREPISRS